MAMAMLLSLLRYSPSPSLSLLAITAWSPITFSIPTPITPPFSVTMACFIPGCRAVLWFLAHKDAFANWSLPQSASGQSAGGGVGHEDKLTPIKDCFLTGPTLLFSLAHSQRNPWHRSLWIVLPDVFHGLTVQTEVRCDQINESWFPHPAAFINAEVRLKVS